jgi:simple sugar transport system permease protein
MNTQTQSAIFRRYAARSLNNLIWVLVVIVVVGFSIASNKFLKIETLSNILLHASVLGLLVVGQTLVFMTGNFDLSAESTVGLTAFVGAWLVLPAGSPANGSGLLFPVFLSILIMLALGAGIGWINGTLITRLKMNNFIVTLAMQIGLRGVVLVINNGFPVFGTPSSFNWLGSGRIGSVPVAIIVVILGFVVGYFVLHRTRFGRELYAVGANSRAARVAGVNTDRRIRNVYVISGLFAGIGGLMLAGQISAVTTDLGQNMTFDIFAAAVIGGVSLNGGRGSMIGALGGVLLLSVIAAGLNLIDISPFWLDTVRGLVILFAMIVDSQKSRFQFSGPARRTQESKGTRVGVSPN